MGNNKYDRNVGYGSNKLSDKAVKAYGEKVYHSFNKDAYAAESKVSSLIPKTPLKEKRQFLNCVADYLQKYF